MLRFRKKPVVIQAMQWHGPQVGKIDDWLALESWMLEGGAKGKFIGDKISIETLEGVMEASPGDWIIKGVKGEFYPCKPDIFEETYDPA